MRVEPSGKPDAWKLARPVWGWGRGETPRPTPHDVAQECGLGDLNELEDPDEQDAHIGSVEESASGINNGGIEEQIRFLLKQGVSPERIREAMEAAE